MNVKKLALLSLLVSLALGAGGCLGDDDDGGGGGDDIDGGPSADGNAGIDADLTDTTAPAMATGFTATGSTVGAPQVDLAWTNPTDADFAGVLILRRFRAAVADAPTDGATHDVGTMIGESEVVFSGTDTTSIDTAVIGGNEYHYAVFAFDEALNYAGPATDSARPVEFFDGVISVPAADGAVTVLHPAALPSITVTGDVAFIDGGAQVTLQFVNETDRIMFNPKLTVTNETGGAAYASPDGTIGGIPFAYFGPTGLDVGATGPTVTFTFRNIADAFTFDVELLLHPSMFVSQSTTAALTVVDTGQDAEVANAALMSGTWFSTMTADARTLLLSAYDTPDVYLFDTTRNAIRTSIALTPEPPGTAPGKGGGVPGQQRPAGIALSADETRAYVASAVIDIELGDSTLFLIELDITTTPPVEVARVDLGTHPTNASSIARGLTIDYAANRAFVANYDNGLVHVVELATMSEVDTDGVPDNGVTPIAFGAGLESVKTMVINPAGTHMYVGFGQRSSSAIAEIDLADLTAFTLLPVTTPAAASGSNLRFGPAGRLFVPRTQYPNADPADVDSFGLSVFDLSADPIVEQFVPVLGSTAASNNDIWDVVFPPGTNRGYISMCDSSELFAFTLDTLAPIDIDGDPANGHTNMATNAGQFYGGAMLLTH